MEVRSYPVHAVILAEGSTFHDIASRLLPLCVLYQYLLTAPFEVV